VVSALCGSEMKDYRSNGIAGGNIGHEAAGIIEAVGADVKYLKPGMRVGVSAIAGCGQCDQCKAGRYTWCSHFSFFGNMHSEYFVIPELACHVLPDDVPWEVGVLITGDGLGVPFHTATKISDSQIKTVAVLGLGPIGLGNVLMQSYLGRDVIGVDISEHRLSLATKMGAKHVIKAQGDVIDRIKLLTDGRGVDVCIEAAGLPVTAMQCFKAVRVGGTVVFNGEQSRIEISPSEDLIRRDIHAIGAWFYHFCEFKGMLELFHKGLNIGLLNTTRMNVKSASDGYTLMAEGRCGKCLLTYEKSDK
jgi:threonine dehydrogenase-like Zn-dependent dehydrogenase